MDIIFTPQLIIRQGTTDISFYRSGFDAIEVMRRDNEDGSVHVAEFRIGPLIFYVHEEKPQGPIFSPERNQGTSVILGLQTDKPDDLMHRAVSAGALVLSEMQDYDYGLRQGIIQDPFGHHWMIQGIITKPIE